MKSYSDLFDVRGSAYDRAMRCHPRARDQEFLQAIARARLTPGQSVADVPAGGGYLADYLPAGVQWSGHEPCASFIAPPATDSPLPPSQPLLPLPWANDSQDAVISLAGVHHIEDKRPLFADMQRVTKPGGRLVLSDVAAGSDVASFLDGFVGAHNSTGHEGAFLGDATREELRSTGWQVNTCELVRFHWCFSHRSQMADFCRQLFDLQFATHEAIDQAIDDTLGVDVLPSGQTGMRWSLLTITASKST